MLLLGSRLLGSSSLLFTNMLLKFLKELQEDTARERRASLAQIEGTE